MFILTIYRNSVEETYQINGWCFFISIPQSFREISHWEIINEDYTLR
jgi:hypothetical protein